MGCIVWFNRTRILRLWQKAEAGRASRLRPDSDVFPLLRFEYHPARRHWYRADSSAVLRQDLIT